MLYDKSKSMKKYDFNGAARLLHSDHDKKFVGLVLPYYIATEEDFSSYEGVASKDMLVFLGKRHSDKDQGAGLWAMLGGKADPGERTEQAAAREFNEESNSQVSADDLDYIGQFESVVGEVCKVFLLEVDRRFDPSECKEYKREHDNYGWFKLDDLPHHTFKMAACFLNQKQDFIQDKIAVKHAPYEGGLFNPDVIILD